MRKLACLLFIPTFFLLSCAAKPAIILSCDPTNDLYVVLQDNGFDCIRYNNPSDAIRHAPRGGGVMILADGYPHKTVAMDESLYGLAREKQLRLYVEYPSYVPGYTLAPAKGTHWERAVISSDEFLPELESLRILAIHDCKFIPMEMENPEIVVARVAGFDRAVFGLPELTYPILGELPCKENEGKLILSSTKLSQFVTARYSPADAWTAIWESILSRLLPDARIAAIQWTPNIRPSYTANQTLPGDVEKSALKRGIDWYYNSGMIMTPAMVEQYEKPTNSSAPASADPDLKSDWPFGHRVGFMPDLSQPPGDGSLGVLEGFDTKIFYDGSQPVRWWRRADCNGEIAGALAVAGAVLDNPEYARTAGNVGDWLFFNSILCNEERNDPANPAYGLIGWVDVPEYVGPGSIGAYEIYYGDDEARTMLGMILAGAMLKTDRFDDRLMKGLLANLRVSGPSGFQPSSFSQGDLMNNGWQYFNRLDHVHYSGNFQAYMWACYLWAYQQTGYEPFLKKARTGIHKMMSGYPRQWGVTGMQMDRARMILPLAWLVRVEDTTQHREWLRRIYDDMGQDLQTGAIPEIIAKEDSQFGQGHYKSPKSNEEYGMTESPIIHDDGDSCSDMLYCTNFAFIGLHEAYAATGEDIYGIAEKKLAEFLCRIQIDTRKHSEFDGVWFWAFDFNRWEYWASSGDAGWGAWCIESGWSQSWITITLALRELDKSFWEITSNRLIDTRMENLLKQFSL